MKKLNFFKFIIIACSAVIVISFFLPWVSAGSKQAGTITKIFSGESKDGMITITGLQIPVMANSDDAKLLINIAKVFSPNLEHADKKSFLVLLIPLLAIIIALLHNRFGKKTWLNLLTGVLGILIFAVPVFKILTTDLDKVIMQVKIETGLWLIFYSYLLIGLISLVKFMIVKGRR